MLLRSSSTPILGSLLSSSSSSSSVHNSESPNKHHHHHPSLGKASSLSSSSFHHIRKPSFAFNICPLPDSSPNSNHESSPVGGFRRARSDGNLLSLLSSDHRSTPNHLLDSVHSLSLHSATGEQSREYNEDGEREDLLDEESFVCQDRNLKAADSSWGVGHSAAPLFLARGLGIDRIGSGLLTAGDGGGFDGGGSGGGGRGGGGEDRSDIENYYRRMVEENPSDALFLSNYAQFLYKTKGDSRRAEEYYSRAILAEPGDGEILSQYAKLIWELHHDKERASSYFEQAVRATPSDSNVLAAYANFLWETEDDDDGDDGTPECYFEAPVCHKILA